MHREGQLSGSKLRYINASIKTTIFAVATKKNSIEAIIPEGIKTGYEIHEVDLIVFATGFDVIDDSFNAIGTRGMNGLSLR